MRQVGSQRRPHTDRLRYRVELNWTIFTSTVLFDGHAAASYEARTEMALAV